MLDRKLLVNALRVENEDVLPKFGTPELKEMLEAATEYISILNIIDLDDKRVTEDGAFSILDILSRGSAGITDEDGQPALNFIKSGDEIHAHNMYTDEDEIIDATVEAVREYIQDQYVIDVEEIDEAIAPEVQEFIENNKESLKAAFFANMNQLKMKDYWKNLDPQNMRKDQDDYAEVILVNNTVDDWCASHEMVSAGVEAEAMRAYLKEHFKEFLVQWQAENPVDEAATEAAENVVFKREPNEYTGETDVLAVFIDQVEQAGDEGRILVYSHVGQHSYADHDYLEGLEDATPEEYEDLKTELEGQGYTLNVLNGIQDESVNEEAFDFKGIPADELYDFLKEVIPELELDLHAEADIAILADSVAEYFEIECNPEELKAYLGEKDLIPTVQEELVSEELHEIDPQLDEIYNRIQSTASDVKNILITAYRNDEERGLKELDGIYSFVESVMAQLLKDVYEKANPGQAYDEE